MVAGMPRRPMPHPALIGCAFTAEQAASFGVTPGQLRGPAYRRVLRRAYTTADTPDSTELRAMAVRAVLPPRAVVWTATAAWLWGVDVRRAGDLDLDVSFPESSRLRRQPGLRIALLTLDNDDVCVASGLRVTTPTRTAFDCLRYLPRPAGVAVADHLINSGHCTLEALTSYIAARRAMRNIRAARRELEHVEPLAQSVQETRTRLLLVDGGLPRPVAQHRVDFPEGDRAYLDLAYPELKIGIEYDGEIWHKEQRAKDEHRRRRLERLGWTIIVLHADDLFRTPEQTVADIRRALRYRSQTRG
jgi:very-short-patch-repair endonuclease